MHPVSAAHCYIGHSEWLIYEISEWNFLSVQFYTSIRPSLDVIDGSAEIHHLCHCFWHESSRSKSGGQGAAAPLPQTTFSVILPPSSLSLSPWLSVFHPALSLSFFSSPLLYKDARKLSALVINNFQRPKVMCCTDVARQCETAGGKTSNPKCVLHHLADAARLTNHFHD